MKTLQDRTAPNTFIPAFVVAAVLSPCFFGQLQAAERPSKPNIIIMMADDMDLKTEIKHA